MNIKNVKVSDSIKNIIGKLVIEVLEKNNDIKINFNNLDFIEENKDLNNKYIRKLLISIGNKVFRKDENENNAFTIEEKDIRKYLKENFPKIEKIDISLNGTYHKNLNFNYNDFIMLLKQEILKIKEIPSLKDILIKSKDPLFSLFIENVKKEIKNGNKIVLTDIRKPNELFSLLEESKDLSISPFLLLPTNNENIIEKYDIDKLQQILLKKEKLENLIKQIEEEKICIPLEGLNTILTYIKANNTRIPFYQNDLQNIDKIFHYVLLSDRKDRNLLIKQIINLKNTINNSDITLLNGISGVGKDTILEIVKELDKYNITLNKEDIIFNDKKLDFTKAEKEIENYIKNNIINIKNISDLDNTSLINKFEIKFLLNIPTLRKKYNIMINDLKLEYNNKLNLNN